MKIELIKIGPPEADQLLKIYQNIFSPFLAKYHDDEINPSKVPKERLVERLNQDFRDSYFINCDGNISGCLEVIRVTWDFEGQDKIHLAMFGMLPEFQNQGIAQTAFRLLEKMYHPKDGWELATLLQEERNIHFYEKLGFKRTGEIRHFNDFLDTVGFEKK